MLLSLCSIWHLLIQVFLKKTKVCLRRKGTIESKSTIYPPTDSCVLVAQLCLTLCDPMDCSLPSSSVHGLLQARLLEWVLIPFSRGSSWLRDWTWVFHIADRFFTIWATREGQPTGLGHSNWFRRTLLATFWMWIDGFPPSACSLGLYQARGTERTEIFCSSVRKR